MLLCFTARITKKTYLETKCVLSGQNETPRTHEPWPERVPAKLACCLREVKEKQPKYNNKNKHKEVIQI